MLVIPIVEMFRNALIRGTARSIVPRRNAPNVCAPAVPVSMNVVVPEAGPTMSGSTPRSWPANTCACMSISPGTTSLPVTSISRVASPDREIREPETHRSSSPRSTSTLYSYLGHGRPRRLPARLPGHLQLARNRRGRPRDADARQPRSPVHARRAVREGQSLPRAHAGGRPASAPAAAHRAQGRGALRADLVGRGARRDRLEAARDPRGVRRRGDLAVPGHGDARLRPRPRGPRGPAAVERARRVVARHDGV